MFSQYSWGDFIKFCLALVIPYYAFVAWKFYRDDIREWISSRGQKNQPTLTDEEEEQEEGDPGKYYTVNSYSGTQTPPAIPTAESTRPAAQSGKQPPSVDSGRESAPAELAQTALVADNQPSGFELPILVEGYRPQEVPIDQILETAKGLVVDERGEVTAKDPADKKASKLASALNEQQGNRVFGDMSFNR